MLQQFETDACSLPATLQFAQRLRAIMREYLPNVPPPNMKLYASLKEAHTDGAEVTSVEDVKEGHRKLIDLLAMLNEVRSGGQELFSLKLLIRDYRVLTSAQSDDAQNALQQVMARKQLDEGEN